MALSKENVSFWKIIENDFGTKISSSIKNVLYLTGYKDAISIKNLDVDRIERIENFVRRDIAEFLQRRGVAENDFIHFYGMDYVGCNENFQFTDGDKDTILNVAKYVRDIVEPGAQTISKSGIGYFKQKPKAKQQCIDWHRDSNIKVSRAKVARESFLDQYKGKLVDKIVSIVRRLNCCSADELKTIELNTLVKMDGESRVRGTIGCLWCKKDNKENNISVHLQFESEKVFFWVVSNFTTHLKAHGINTAKAKKDSAKVITKKNVPRNVGGFTQLPKQKIDSNDQDSVQLLQEQDKESKNDNIEVQLDQIGGQKVIIREMGDEKKIKSSGRDSVEKQSDQIDEQNVATHEMGGEQKMESNGPDSVEKQSDQINEQNVATHEMGGEQKIESNGRISVQSMEKEETESNNGNSEEQIVVNDFETVIDSDIIEVDEAHQMPNDQMKSIEDEIYEQILDQINSMKGYAAKKRNTQKMHFYMGKKSELLQVVKIAKDGDCLFRSAMHQFFDLELGSDSQEGVTEQARSNVVGHIKTNLERFKQIIKTCTQIEGNEDADYLRYLDTLSNSGEWGGTEALLALSEYYKVNIIIVNEMGPAYMLNDFMLENSTCILLAYRLSSESKKAMKKDAYVRNHYDSIINMDVSLIAELAKLFSNRYLAKQALDPNVIQTLDDSMIVQTDLETSTS